MTIEKARQIEATLSLGSEGFDAMMRGEERILPFPPDEYDKAREVLAAEHARLAAQASKCPGCEGLGCARCGNTGQAFGA